MKETLTAQAALDRLEAHYSQSVANLRDAVGAFIANGARTSPEARAGGIFTYPQLRVSWFGERLEVQPIRAYARLSRPGVYSTTVTRPDLFRTYLEEQLTLLEED